MAASIRTPHLLSRKDMRDQSALRPERILLLCFYDPWGISTVKETVAYIQTLSEFPITILNMFEYRFNEYNVPIPPNVDLEAFSTIVIHNTIAYDIENLRSLDRFTRIKLRNFSGVKVIMKQDESFRFKEVAQYVGETGFDIVFTCLPADAVPLVYAPATVGTPHFERMLTGYITPQLRELDHRKEPRRIDIGYRGSIQPLQFGRLALEKRKIGDDVARRLLDRHNLILDISSNPEDRFGGVRWFEFLQNCKATLGVETGASIFDLNGDMEERNRRAIAELGEFRYDDEYAEAYLSYLTDLEDVIDYRQISPRHFEAAAAGTLQLLYPGNYSGIFVADRHYFPLAKDYSNFEEAIEIVCDPVERRRFTEAAHEEIVLNREYWIETFVSSFDRLIAKELECKSLLRKPSRKSPAGGNLLMLVAHEPDRDPRLKWVAESSSLHLDTYIHQLGISDNPQARDIVTTARGALKWSAAPQSWHAEIGEHLHAVLYNSDVGMMVSHEMQFLETSLSLRDSRFCEIFGIPMSGKRTQDFRWHLRHVLDVTATLITEALKLRGVHGVIACDLITLPSALILKALWGVPVIYDAHEYWPEADLNAQEFEKDFWRNFERRLLGFTDYRQTVSPGLAKLMQSEYGVPFESVPNCEPLTDSVCPERRNERHERNVYFLYQGGFARGRGIDLLINAWPETDTSAILLLRGVGDDARRVMMELAEETNLLGSRIFFPDPVSEDELIAAAAEADVGIVPYPPTGENHMNCCPNKISQYMAAGLPILANDTRFVAEVVTRAQCGKVLNFENSRLLVKAVNELCRNPDLRKEFGESGRQYFKATFNWQSASRIFYQALAAATEMAVPQSLCIYDLNTVPPESLESRIRTRILRTLEIPWRIHRLIQRCVERGDLEPIFGAVRYRIRRLRNA